MLTITSRMTLTGLSGREITDFLLECDDVAYQAWWPGTHRELHVIAPSRDRSHVGDLVWMDERVGSRHLRMAAEVLQVVPGERVVWGLRPWRLRLPVRLVLTLRDLDAGVVLCHTLTAGWTGWARVFDPLWRVYFSESFARAMDTHARTEFERLGPLLHPDGPGPSAPEATRGPQPQSPRSAGESECGASSRES